MFRRRIARSSRRTCLALAAAAGALAALTGAASAQVDRIIDTPTGWIYRFGVTPATIDADVANGFKPFMIQRTAPDSYNVIAVQNSGDYQIPGFSVANTYWAQTPAGLGAAIAGERIIDLECFELNNQTVMSAVTIPNSGAQASGWGWLYDTTAQTIIDWVSDSQTPIRVIDIERYEVNGQARWAAVAVNNSGAQAQGWWWLFNVDAAAVSNLLTSNGARLIDVEITTPATIVSPPLYTVIAVADNPGRGWFYPSLSSSEITDLRNQHGARITCMERFTDGLGQTRYAVGLVDNANDITRRCRDLMDAQLTSGTYGFKVKQVGGPVIAALNDEFAFEPASMLKILHGAYAMRQCSLVNDTLISNIWVRDTCNNNECPDTGTTCNPGFETLGTAIAEMLQQSDNNRTMEIELRYGRATLNAFADSLGLTNTQINHRLGCLCGDPFNSFSATDAVDLYEKIADGSLFSELWRDQLFDRMNNPSLNTVIDQEAVGLSLTPSEIAAFKSLTRMAAKAGSYGCSGTVWKPEGGWATIPFKVNGNVVPREYTYAAFVHGCTNSDQADVAYTMKRELLREQVRAALVSWDAACTDVVITNQPDNRTVNTGADVTFLTQNSGTVDQRRWQWSQNGVSGWVNLSNIAGQISGATSATLTLSNVNAADAGYYRLSLTSDCDSAVSAAARLIVRCPADFNNSGSATVQDIFDYLDAYFAGLRSADFNGSGSVTVQDIFDYLEAYFAGC